MKNPSQLERACRKICALALVLMSLCLLLNPLSARAQGGSFDHAATAFPLLGSHEQVRCETCHIKGIFKSTPKDCAGCHAVNNQRGAMAMPYKHIQITGTCDTCHNVSSFSAVVFSHSAVGQGSCGSCHDGIRAKGKSQKHIATTLSCDACHTSLAFLPINRFPHTSLGGDTSTCATCHNGSSATGMPANHVPRSNPAQCGSCHVNSTLNDFTSFSGGKMDHTGMTSGCADCHGPSISGGTFAGISSIIVMPPTSPAGPSSHIPSSIVCESCHLASMPVGLIEGNASRSAPGSGFATPAPTGVQIHAGVTGGCSNCHETNFSWMGVNAYPITPSTLIVKAQYKGFQTRPTAAGGSFNVADAGHPSTGDCSQCHTGTVYFSIEESKPANHIPTSNAALCSACHTVNDFKVMPTLANIHANAPSTSANCAQCHSVSAAASFAVPASNFAIVAPPANHIPTSAACETCHVGPGSSMASMPVGNGAKFSGSAMSHTGITSNCEACHGPSITASSFTGISKIVVMPATAPMGANAHIPSSTTCETCHLATTPAGLVPASASKSAPGTLFATPAPTGAQIHTGITGGCSACHDTNFVWMGVTAYPIAPSVLSSGAQYTGFQTRPKTAAGTFSVADAAHPSTGDCSECHAGTNYFAAEVKPGNHIPTAATAQCSACHTSTDFAAMPTLANIHGNAPSSTGNCAQCHAASVVAGFAIPAANFLIVGPPANHLPITTGCETCHVGAGSSVVSLPVANGAKFSASLMSHTGIATNCIACHGPSITGGSFAGVTQIVVMPPTSPMGAAAHIPSTTPCETCHLGSTPAGLVPASASKSAPGTAFATPAPTGAQIHTGITAGCSACHDTNAVWMGVSAYPIAPGIMSTGAQYRGFQTRPKAAAGTYSVADAAHPNLGDCSQCHSGTSYFSGQDKPANHIPTSATAQCAACHTSSDYAVMPTLANIHANAPSTTGNCAQCHGANVVAGFAIPAANFLIVGPPANHIPSTGACETCHVGSGSSVASLPVGDGAKFSNSLMSHTGITSNCQACHGPSITGSSFTGISKIVVMPATSPMGAGAHIPSSTTCETCHLASTPTDLVSASASKSAPGTAFATPAPTTTQIHTGITGGCSACHDTNFVWMGVSAYPIAPTNLTTGAQYTGFQTRPKAVAGTYSVADQAHPAAGDCSQCHSGVNYFTGQDKPANHIPTAATAQCSACHTSSDYSALPTLANIHANAPSTTGNCAQCHAANVVAGFAIPGANFLIVGPPANHLPITTACETCHVGAGSSVASLPVGNGAKFSGSTMSHSGISSNCQACHGPSITGSSFAGVTQIVVMPATSPMGSAAHIPSSTTCETCHLGSTPAGTVPASASKTAPGTAFATPAPTTTQIHTGITGGCSACHDTNFVWMGVSVYPIAPTTLTTGAQYTGFQTRPKAVAGTFSVADAAHPAAGDCSQCHSGVNYFTGQDKPANHIPTAATAQCSACHTSSDYSALPTLANIHANAPSTTGNCAQCHAANVVAGFAIPGANFLIVGPPANHLPITTACETCHVGAGSSVASLPVGNGAKFSGSSMSHTGITSNCQACHGPSITGSSFAGVTQIVVMPATSPMGTSSHMPSSTVCETCHLGSTPAGTVPASASKSAPGTAFATPAPTTAQIHTGISGGCSACHDTNFVWMGVSAYPIAPTNLTTGAQYTGFQTRPKAAAGTYSVADAAHPSAGDCSQCHSGVNYFTGQDKPANHIPTAATAQCSACHTSSDYSALPTLANIHANAPSTTGNCAQCHGANVVAGFAIPGANFLIVGPPANHLPITTACESCHVGAGSSVISLPVANGARFSGSLMSHAGITSNCIACHGPSITGGSFVGVSQIVVMPPTSPSGVGAHIPSTTSCETCHLATTPSGLIAASASKSAPGTAFQSPAPTTTQIHTGITGGCSGCHDTNFVWMGVNAYPIAPSVLTTGAQYTGFQTRPKAAAGAYSVADAAHPSTGDCSQCHSGTNYFTGQDKPANHIPTSAAAQCNSCHTSSDYAAMPTLTAIHANAPSTTSNCAQCHGAAAASFAIPAAGFSIQGLPGNHLPTTASCETCHVGAGSSIASLPVVNGARFSGSLMSHTGITSNCVACHVPSGTSASFAGIAQIVGMPATSPMGANAHIPSSTTCETCHLATTPTGLIAASSSKTAPGTAFQTPAPTGVQIHTGITGGCSACHDTSAVWMGVNTYPISPSVKTTGAQYRGFQSRPSSAAGTYNVADATHPSAGDCSQCHSGTTYFSGQDKPANHIPTAAAAQCTACHTSTDYAVMPTMTAIHANAPSTTNNCAQCHGAAAPSFAIPAANFSIVGLPANHIPTTGACETCHVGSGSSIASLPVVNGAKFSGSLMSHTGITSNCVACHVPSGTSASFAGIAQIVGMPATSPVGANAHIPSSTTCETCHLGTTPTGLIAASATKTAPGTAFQTPAPTGVQIHTGITGGCAACHDTSAVWMGVSAYPISPSVMTTGAQYKGFQTRPKTTAGSYNVSDATHPSAGDCSQCHSGTTYFTGQDKPANHIPTAAAAQCTSCHTSTDYSVMPTMVAIHANAPSTTNNCAQCHGAAAASFAIPAANFSIVGLPANHIPTTVSCESCHVGSGSSIASLPVVNGARFSGSLMSHTGITSNCVSCHVPSGTSASFAGIAQIVGMPPTSPVGAGSHIPSSTTCESCHLATTPTGLIAASAAKTAPGTAFQNPAPTGVQIHAGITGGCSACHDTNAVWMGMNAYPISPSTLTAGAPYRGFQARPGPAAGTFTVADAAHPSTGDCSQCHSGTVFFTAQDKPANHIPTAAAAQCNSCHTSTDYAVLPTLANIHANAPSTTANCAQCHGAAAASFAIPAANFSIQGLPTNHMPTLGACETCHVGGGSSIASLPVGNGAKFSGSLMSHTGITSNCEACHGSSITGTSFVGVSKIVVMPPTSPVGANAHIPSTTTCETCHLATTPTGLIAASATKTAPGTAFATPAPTGVQIHTGITGNCSSCHDTSFVWMGVAAYPIAPSTMTTGAQYKGFQTRPKTTAGTFNVADAAHPSAGDCSQCHSGTTYFSGQDKPANHIPTSATAQCSACHTSTDYAAMPTLANIHANAPSKTTNCAQCHDAAVVAGFAIPAANFTIQGPPANHMPITTACEICHVGAGSSVSAAPVPDGAKFSGSRMSHTGITSNCIACHGSSITGSSFAGVGQIVVMPPTSPVGAGAHIPSTTSCETCHAGTTPSGLIAANATKTAPGTLFATPAPTGAQIHTGITGGCSSCHDTNFVWMGVNVYPISPSVKTTGAQYKGFQTRPKAAASTFSVADATHPAAGDCSQCHSGTTYFSGQDKPANHIPTLATAQCTACHTSTDYAVMPTLANIHANAPSMSTNCAQCHDANVVAGFAIPAANFVIVGPPANHMPITTPCETCHVGAGSSVTATPVPNGAKFGGSKMSHTGITSNCIACHGASITGSSFIGITQIVVMPPTSPVGAAAHIPSTTSCETCHAGTTPAGLIAANATKSAPGTLFATPAPTGAQIHTGITGGCSSCHDTGYVWMGVGVYPIAPSVLTTGAQYRGFQTRPKAAAGTYSVADAAHPSAGDCSQCHSGTVFFTGQDKPSNHIPTSATAQCSACHTSADYAAMPTLANIHAYAPSKTTNCAQCHDASVVAGFAIPAANFAIQGPPANHMPITTPCETCHVGAGSSVTATPVPDGAKFSGSRMSHTGITSNCIACHGSSITGTTFAGVTKIVVMPPTSPVGAAAHIPSTTSCETCHAGTTPAGLIAANATLTVPGTAFATPAPSGAQIHTGITGGCNACHDTNYVWMGMSAYPIAPSVMVAGAQYKGFQTRPKTAAGTYSVADPAHPSTGDCSQCHTGTTFFAGEIMPANHIPFLGTAQCTACHTSTDYSVMPTLANIHANAPSKTNNCAQCHDASVVAGFAIPLAKFVIVGPPVNHMPITTACEICHVGTGSSVSTMPVPNGAKFSSSLMSHTGITSNCAACHGQSITGSTFAGVTKIIVMPPTSPAGAAAHIPSSSVCENCHLGTTPTGLVAASATKTLPGSAFATPAPTTTQIHAGITGGCNACHDTNFVWMGMNQYPMAPALMTVGAQYTGFHSRPTSAGSTYAIKDAAHPSAGDCSQCHTGTNYFSGLVKPTGHIPTTGTCSTCHIVSGDYSIAGLASNAILHTGISSGCITCHTAGAGAGPFAGCTTQAACASPPPLTYQPMVMPLLAGGSPTTPSKSTHVPSVGIACEKCHSPSVFTSFTGMNMKSNTNAHLAVATATCMSCHEYLYTWFGVTIKTTGSASHHSRKATQDCIACHTKVYSQFSGASARVRPVMRGALNTLSQHVLIDGILTAAPADGTQVFNHAGVLPGQCQTCHNAMAAAGKPAKHLQTTLACDSCHRTSAWKPAQFSHEGVLPGQCQACHNAASATGKTGGHFVTVRSCDSCHRTVAWVPVSYQHLSPLFHPQADKSTCLSCHVTNGEIIPRQMRGNNRPKPVPVHTGP